MSEVLNLNADFIEAAKTKAKLVPVPQVDPVEYTREVLAKCKVIKKPIHTAFNL
jgi:hypothetical protein